MIQLQIIVAVLKETLIFWQERNERAKGEQKRGVGSPNERMLCGEYKREVFDTLEQLYHFDE
jgi:hypothetical protein